MASFGTSHRTWQRVIPPIQRWPLQPIPTTPILYEHFPDLLPRSLLFQTDPCGLQLFHLLSHTQGSGGATLLVDGFYVASILKDLHPDIYYTLSNVPVPAHAAGETASLYRPFPPSGYPVLSHDPVTGELSQVRWNNDDRSVMSHLKPSEVEAWSRVSPFI